MASRIEKFEGMNTIIIEKRPQYLPVQLQI